MAARLIDEQTFYHLCHMFIKLSYLAFYHRFSHFPRYRIALYVTMALASMFGIGAIIANSLMCVPLPKLWNPSIPGSCIDIGAFFISTGAISIAFDAALLLIPIPICWGLKCKRINVRAGARDNPH